MRNKASNIKRTALAAAASTLIICTASASAEFDLLLQKFEIDASGKVVLDEGGKAIPAGPQWIAHSQGNLITNSGMDTIGNTNGKSGNSFTGYWGIYCRVGGGSTAPAFTDTALTSPIAAQSRSGGSDYTVAWGTGADLNKVIITVTHTFAVGSATGNLTEIGLSETASGNLQTHALFLDSGGNPIVIQPQPDEQLVSRYRLKLTPPSGDATFSVTTSPTPTAYSITMRPANLGTSSVSSISSMGAFGATTITAANCYTGASSGLGASTGAPTGVQQGSMNVPTTYATYVAGSFESTGTIIIQPTMGNFADIGAIRFYGSLFEWQLGLSPRLTKAQPQTIKLTVKTKWVRG